METMWHYAQGSAVQGPIPHGDLCALFASSELPLETQVWCDGMAGWAPASTIDDFRGIWGKSFGPRRTDPPRLPEVFAGRPGLSPIAPDASSAIPLGAPPDARARRSPRGTEDANDSRLPDESDDGIPQARPWVRYWARSLDGVFMLAAFSLFVSKLGADDPWVILFAIFGLFIVQVLLLSTFGTTAGKALLGTSISTANGDRMSFFQAIGREFAVAVQGLGLGIPIVSLATMVLSYVRLTGQGITSWDQSRNLIVRHGRIGVVRTMIAIVASGAGMYFVASTFYSKEVDRIYANMNGGANRRLEASGRVSIQPTTPAAPAFKSKPRLLTLPSDKSSEKVAVKSKATTARPTTRPSKPQNRPAPRVVFTPATD